jgi:beta-glucuronidase
MREQIDMTGTWTFHVDPRNDGEKAAYFSPDHDASRWREVSVPCAFEDCAPGLDFYDGAGWFRRRVRVPKSWRGRRVVIRFEGANYHTSVYVNGRLAGQNDLGFLRFELPVHEHLRFGGWNLFAVRVDGDRRWGEVPGAGGTIGWRSFAGILRGVALEASDMLRIARVRIDAAPGGRFSLRASVANDRAADAATELRVKVSDRAGEVLARLSSETLKLGAGAAAEIGVDGAIEGAQAWSPEKPALYTAAAELVCDGQVVDRVATRFGFRRIEARDGKLLLNGAPIFLTGFNRHEDSPRKAMCTDLRIVRQDILDMQAAGANFVRLCHYPHDPGELDLCDELGMLAMCEIPLWWWSDQEERQHGTAEAKLAFARRMLEAMILRDINHPSVIFWSVSNETHEEQPGVVEGNIALIGLAKRLDPSRPAVHVSCYGINLEHAHFEADDVICLNAYPSYWGGFCGNPEDAGRFWAERLAALHEKHPGKPILISEFGHPCIEGESGGIWGEDTAAKAIEHEFAGMTAPYVCGATIWCWADHAWPHLPGVHGVIVSPFGVVARSRRKLKPYHAARKMFKRRHLRLGRYRK